MINVQKLQSNNFYPNTMPDLSIKTNGPNPVAGFKKLVAYGAALVVLLAIGATPLWPLAYGIEAASLLALLLNKNGTQALAAFSNLLKGTLT